MQVAGLRGHPFEGFEKRRGSVAFATGGVVVHGVGMFTITQVHPEPASMGSAAWAGLVHFHGGVVGMDDFGLEYAGRHQADDRFKDVGGSYHPVAQGFAGEVHAVAREDAFLAVEWQVVGVLAHDDVRQEAGPGNPFSMGWAGLGATATPSWQCGHAYTGWMWSITNSEAGAYSSCSVVFSPIRFFGAPHCAQVLSASGTSC